MFSFYHLLESLYFTINIDCPKCNGRACLVAEVAKDVKLVCCEKCNAEFAYEHLAKAERACE